MVHRGAPKTIKSMRQRNPYSVTQRGRVADAAICLLSQSYVTVSTPVGQHRAVVGAVAAAVAAAAAADNDGNVQLCRNNPTMTFTPRCFC